jgi:DNA-binding GntR family transcriptional regulator
LRDSQEGDLRLANKVPRKTAEEAGSGSRLSDVAYARILEILFSRRLPAGSFVSQAELVELTCISVGPLRDALRVLEAEGVLKIHPRTGIQFVKPGFELTRSSFQFRGIIEAAAVTIFVAVASESEIATMAKKHAEVIAKVERNGLTSALAVEVEALEQLLHGTIVASLNNPLVDAAYRRIHNYLRLLRLDRRITKPLALRTLQEHAEIIDACRCRDPAAAVAALKAHFSAALQRTFGLY